MRTGTGTPLQSFSWMEPNPNNGTSHIVIPSIRAGLVEAVANKM